MLNKATDPTFQAYSAAQAQAYNAGRYTAYSVLLYSAIFDYHTQHNGTYDLLLDVGCGPGNATRDLASSFVDVVAVDPGAAMIDTARAQGYETKSGKKIRFEVCPAEDIASLPGLGEESVDIITAAMAAHWFDMPRFWEEAAKVLKPGGTVALWTCSSLYCHPSTPNANDVQRILFKLERETLAPFELPPNRLSRDMYVDLTLPWQCARPVECFSKDAFVRHEWDKDGILSDGKSFFDDKQEESLERLERDLDTASMVTRWREANIDLAGTERDCVKMMINELREALGGAESFSCGSSTALLLFRKASDMDLGCRATSIDKATP